MQHNTYRKQPVGCGIFRRFSNLDKGRPEADGDVISGGALDYVGTDVPAGHGDSQLNSGRIIRCPAGSILRTFVQYLITFCSRPEATGGVISGRFVEPIVLHTCVKFHDHTLHYAILEKFHPKPSEAVFLTVSPYNFRPDVDNDVISGLAIDNVGVNVCVKFGDLR